MPGLGPGGRRFESFHPDLRDSSSMSYCFFFASVHGFDTVPVGMKGFGPGLSEPLFLFAKVSHKHRPQGACGAGWCGTCPLFGGCVPRLPAFERILAGVFVGHFGGNEPGFANFVLIRLGGNKKAVPLRSGKQNGLNQSFPIIELCA